MTTQVEQVAIRAALAEIANSNNGVLTAEAVIEEAKNRNSILHDLFEWDGKKAAHAWRLHQARTLIRSVQVVITTEKTQVSTVCYIRNPDAESDKQGYVATQSLVGDIDRSRIALIAEFSRAAGALRRARELALVFSMEGEVDIALESVQRIHTKITAYPDLGNQVN